MKTQFTHKRSGFTLLELLIVIGIIAILAAVAFPVTGMVLDKARKTEAKNEVMNLVNSVKQYEYEYSKFPIEGGNGGDSYETQSDSQFMKILLGTDEKMNPRGSRYYEGKAAKEGVNGLDYGEGGDDPSLVDPWGNMYYVQIDGNYDGDVIGPTDCGESREIRMSVIGWSKGKPKGGQGSQEFDECKKWPKSW